tara:strand:- start:2469 stop:2954 length:486 start_codon:yes stop_codon:yes gene_type:complete
MTYKTPSRAINAKTRIYELTLSTGQTVNSGDTIKFDTLRQTEAGGGVTNNATSGAITLSNDFRYFLQCSIDVDRVSNLNSIRVAFFNSDLDTELTVSDGAYDAAWIYHSSTVITAQPNPTLQAEYIPTGAAISPIKIKVFDVGNNSTINTNFSLIILESSL